jgi:hypothetical protein
MGAGPQGYAAKDADGRGAIIAFDQAVAIAQAPGLDVRTG